MQWSALIFQVHTFVICTPYPCALSEEDVLTVIALWSVLVSEECCCPYTTMLWRNWVALSLWLAVIVFCALWSWQCCDIWRCSKVHCVVDIIKIGIPKFSVKYMLLREESQLSNTWFSWGRLITTGMITFRSLKIFIKEAFFILKRLKISDDYCWPHYFSEICSQYVW